MHSKWSYKICICSVFLGEFTSFRNCKGFGIISPKILDAIYRITKVKNFFDSSLHHIFESENFRFLLYEKYPNLGNEM